VFIEGVLLMRHISVKTITKMASWRTASGLLSLRQQLHSLECKDAFALINNAVNGNE